MSKYHSKKITVNGITYDSKREYKRHQELLLLEKAGLIKDLQRQVKFVLIPAQYEPDIIGPKGGVKRGKLIERECVYAADFVYKERMQDKENTSRVDGLSRREAGKPSWRIPRDSAQRTMQSREN